MNRFAIILVVCGSLLLTANAAIASLPWPVDDLSRALQKHDYPWYDSDTDQLKPLESKPESTPFTSDRNRVEIGIQKRKPTTPTNQGAGGGTGSTGLTMFDGFSLTPLFIGLLALVIVAALLFLIYNFLGIESAEDDGSGAKRKKLLSESIEQLPFDLQVTDGDFRGMAQQAYQAGDLRRAIIFLYSHVLVTLDQSARIELRKGKTNRQYLKEVWDDPKLSSYFKSVMLPFESAFFGDHDPLPDQFEKCWSNLDQFHTHLTVSAGGGR